MKIYKVTVEYKTVIAANSRQDAESMAHRIINDSDEDPYDVDAQEINALKELPHGWNADCLPWGDNDTQEIKLGCMLD